MSYRVIALNLDGTLLDNQKRILPQSLAALAEARAAGIKVVVATGRHHVAIHPFYQALEIDTPAIRCNGTYLYDFQQKKVLAADPLPKEQARLVLQMLKQSGIHGLMYVDDAMLYQDTSGHITRSLAWAEPCRRNADAASRRQSGAGGGRGAVNLEVRDVARRYSRAAQLRRNGGKRAGAGM